MTDGELLLAAVLANPDEDTPRLVYADWLDENSVDGSGLRLAGYIEFATGPLATHPTRVYWRHWPAVATLLGTILTAPVCDGDGTKRCRFCSTLSDGYYFGGWRCLNCAANLATRTKVGIWEYVNRRQEDSAWTLATTIQGDHLH